jgi:pimeloyl-ACP methyl ester carboxylesterase
VYPSAVGPGHDERVVLSDGRVLEYWEGGDAAGRAMILHPGTPVTRMFGRWGHEAAVAAGVRLVVINRPGYGGSTTNLDASLLETGRDTAVLAAHLELDGYAVFGSSGGGPFAVAVAVADPAHVRALGLIGGVGPWRILDGPSRDPDTDRCVVLLEAGDVDGAWARMRRDVKTWTDELSALEQEPRVDRMLGSHGESSRLYRDPDYRALWAENLQDVVDHPDGHGFDNLSWSRTWDVDPRDVSVPTLLWYSEKDDDCPPHHGRWYAERISGSELTLTPDDTHLDVIDGHWPEVLAALLRIWR